MHKTQGNKLDSGSPIGSLGIPLDVFWVNFWRLLTSHILCNARRCLLGALGCLWVPLGGRWCLLGACLGACLGFLKHCLGSRAGVILNSSQWVCYGYNKKSMDRGDLINGPQIRKNTLSQASYISKKYNIIQNKYN